MQEHILHREVSRHTPHGTGCVEVGRLIAIMVMTLAFALAFALTFLALAACSYYLREALLLLTLLHLVASITITIRSSTTTD